MHFAAHLWQQSPVIKSNNIIANPFVFIQKFQVICSTIVQGKKVTSADIFKKKLSFDGKGSTWLIQ